MRTAYALPLLLALAFTTSGCIVDVDDDDHDFGGNALVYATTVRFDPLDGVYNGPVLSAQYEIPEITPDVVDFGAVLVYFREQGTWTAAPYTFGVESPDFAAVDYTITLGYGYDDRLLEVFLEASTEAIELTDQPARSVKVVVIDNLPVGKAAPDLRDYEQVKAYYNLSD